MCEIITMAIAIFSHVNHVSCIKACVVKGRTLLEAILVIFGRKALRQDPLDLNFWSFLTFLHHGMEDVERHLL